MKINTSWERRENSPIGKQDKIPLRRKFVHVFWHRRVKRRIIEYSSRVWWKGLSKWTFWEYFLSNCWRLLQITWILSQQCRTQCNYRKIKNSKVHQFVCKKIIPLIRFLRILYKRLQEDNFISQYIKKYILLHWFVNKIYYSTLKTEIT